GAVIVEEILGVSKEDIISDYLSTNEFIKNDVRFITDLFKKKAGITDARVDESLGLMLGAEKEYIDSFYQAVDDKYGSINGYIQNGLGVSDE
ncbi:MAG: tyrosine-protein phosphatase, partial [Lachnospiraceae bacterium]|nr:tyrosine-protein phosphatase [Lachnospiraceae bacterium]